MTYDEMIRSLEKLNTAQGVAITATPHCSNLLHQLNKKGSENKTAFNEIYNRYIRTRLIEFTPDNLFQYIERITEEVNNYMGYYWPRLIILFHIRQILFQVLFLRCFVQFSPK